MNKQGFLQSALDGVGALWRRRDGSPNSRILDSQDPEQKGQALFRRGRALMRTGDIDKAIADFDSALELLPDFAEAVAARAEALDMRGRSGEAGPQYERARRLWAEQRTGAPDRCYLWRQHGRFTFEVESYELALKRIKTGSFPHLACGNVLLAQGHPRLALACYERALKIKQNDPGLMALKGEALSALGRHRQAIEAFDFALVANSAAPETLNGRAICRCALGRVDEANADWRRQLDLLPPCQSAARACVALRLADYGAALPELERVIGGAPVDAYWRLYRLTALVRLGAASGGVIGPVETPAGAGWPAPLLELHAGKISADEVRRLAKTDNQRAEAAFQTAVLAIVHDRPSAERHLRQVLELAGPFLIEYGAARNELARLTS